MKQALQAGARRVTSSAIDPHAISQAAIDAEVKKYAAAVWKRPPRLEATTLQHKPFTRNPELPSKSCMLKPKTVHPALNPKP
jgi:hypothetical protein